MRSVSVALAALFGAAAANPAEWPRNYDYGYNPYPTGGSSSSSSASSSYAPSSSSSSSYAVSSSSSSSSSGYPVYTPSSSSSSYYSASSSLSSSGTGYVPNPPHSTWGNHPYSTGYPVPPHSTWGDHPYSTGYHPNPPYSTGVSSSKPPHPPYSTGVSSYPPYSTGYATTETEVLTTYTTTTVCPITTTEGTKVITTLTTSTVTVTECKKGCHHATSAPVPPPSKPSDLAYVPTTITSTTYTWVPCSTAVGNNGGSTIYSTYLTASWYATTYVTSVIAEPTYGPQPWDNHDHPTTTPAPECPAPVTVYNTVTVTVGPKPEDYTTKTLTVTESGYETTYTVTLPVTGYPTEPTYTADHKPPHHSGKPSYSSKLVGPTGGSGYSSIPHPTGYIPYPTESSYSSSVVYSSSRAGPKPTGYHYYGWN